jgi:soluble lytic murein transglycosylase
MIRNRASTAFIALLACTTMLCAPAAFGKDKKPLAITPASAKATAATPKGHKAPAKAAKKAAPTAKPNHAVKPKHADAHKHPAHSAKTAKTPPAGSKPVEKPGLHHAAADKHKALTSKAKGHAHAAPKVAAATLKVPMPPARPAASAPRASFAHALASAVPMPITSAMAATTEGPIGASPLAYAPAATPTAGDIDLVKDGLALARAGKTEAAGARQAEVRDHVGQKLIEWEILRSDSSNVGFARYAAFIQANPHWPSVTMLRRRAEAQLWHENREPGTVFAFFSKGEPISARGRLAMARALLAQGDNAGAARFVRYVWRQDPLPEDVEAQVLDNFGSMLSRADRKARMDYRLYAGDLTAGLREARRLGGNDWAIAQAWAAVARKAHNAGALLEAVPGAARNDHGYMFARIKWLRQNDRIGEAAQLMLSASRDPNVEENTDEWWIERRLIARKLLDADNPQAAYKVARDAATPAKGNYRVDHPFTAGWIALRFLNDPNTAMRHFAEIARETHNPIALARGAYWQGRAAEAAGRNDDAHRFYDTAARYPTAYYGQLARARLGMRQIGVRRPDLSEAARVSARQTDVVRALELLYATGNRDLVVPFVADFADRSADHPAALAAMAEIAARHDDARAMVLIGKGGLSHGHAFDLFAFPGIGIPKVASIGPALDRSVIYSVARQESGFNQRTVSSARAYGLMQVTPAAGRYIAKKFNVTYHEKRLLSDPVYNTQMGAAEICDLVRDYDHNYVLAFAAYNAGRGRVREWIGRYGDPRDPKVDPIDWVERIPFSETRNYVERVMENMQIYRARFGNGNGLSIEADLRGARPQ